MLLRLACLAVTNTFAALRLLPLGDRDKDVEMLAPRHQLTNLERQLGVGARVRFAPEDRAFLAALLAPLPRDVLHRLRLLVRPDTVVRWHRDLVKRGHTRACVPKRRGRPSTIPSIRALVLRLARGDCHWGYRRVHGGLTMLGITVAPSTIWEILKREGVDPAPDRGSTTWADFLRSQARRYWRLTSSRPSPWMGGVSTSWPSSTTPPDASGCSAPPHTRPRIWLRKRSRTWSWIWSTPGPLLDPRPGRQVPRAHGPDPR